MTDRTSGQIGCQPEKPFHGVAAAWDGLLTETRKARLDSRGGHGSMKACVSRECRSVDFRLVGLPIFSFDARRREALSDPRLCGPCGARKSRQPRRERHARSTANDGHGDRAGGARICRIERAGPAGRSDEILQGGRRKALSRRADGRGRILGCLKSHKMDLSVGCAQGLQKMKAQMGQ